MRVIRVAALVAAFTSLGGACGAPAPSGQGATYNAGSSVNAESASPSSVEFKLASIDAGRVLSISDPAVLKFASILDEIESKCPEPKERIGDMLVTSQELLKNGGKDVSLADLARHLNTMIPEDADLSTIGTCAELLTAFVAIGRGKS